MLAVRTGQLTAEDLHLIRSTALSAAPITQLMALGLLPGQRVKLHRIAPLGNPITVEVGGAQVSLRRAEAAHLTVAVHPVPSV